MTKRPSGLTVASTDYGRAIVQDLAVLAVVASVALAGALAVRPVSTYDVGYHLAYGEHFLKTRHIVQTNRFVYTQLDENILSDPAQIGPGCRYEPATNTYRFVNANWLSQVVMAGAYRAGGFVALGVLRLALVLAILAVVMACMRRHGVGWAWIAPAVLLIALTSYERLDIRPELFGYLVLIGQWALLMGRRFDRQRALGVIALQLLAVNLHSYFLLGVALSAAMLADALLRWLWARTVTGADTGEVVGPLRWLAVAAGGAALACLGNPWFARGAIFPVQTILYLWKHRILGAPVSLASHPWAFIGELVPALGGGLRGLWATSAYLLVLALAAPAVIVALPRRRWGWALVLMGLGAVSFQTRRNIALGAFFLVPISAALLAEGSAWLREAARARRPSARLARLRRFGRPALAAVCLGSSVAGIWLTVSVVTNRFYFSERRSWRFGLGATKFMVPVDAAEWINRHRPAGKVWCDFANSSNLMFLTRPRRRVPILTNTWAFPPYVMEQVTQVAAGLRPLGPWVRRYGIGTVVLRYTQIVPPLIATLCRDPGWAVVHVGVRTVVFVRAEGPNAALAAEHRITQENLDMGDFIDRIAAADPIPATALHSTAVLLNNMGWPRPAEACWRRAIEIDPRYPEVLLALAGHLLRQGSEHVGLAKGHLQQNKPVEAGFARNRARERFQEAEKLLRRLLGIRRDDPNAGKALRWVRGQLSALDRTGDRPG